MIPLRSLRAVAALLLCLALSCAAPADRSSAWTARADLRRGALAAAVADPDRREELSRSIDQMDAAIADAIWSSEQLNREFVAAAADRATTYDQLRQIADRNSTARRASLTRMLDARLALRRAMTPSEWQAFAAHLPAFDGELQ